MTLHRLLILPLIAACLLIGPASHANWLEAAESRQLETFDGSTAAKPDELGKDRRGKVVIRRIKPQAKIDWNTDPTALPYFFYQLRERTEGRFPMYLDNEGILLTGDDIFDYPIIYLTSHNSWLLADDEVENLKKYLARGGTLLLDDCTGTGPFVDAVPVNVQRLIPGAESKLMLKETKAFSDLFSMIYVLEHLPRLKEQYMQPFQAYYLNGRPAILICPNDYGCNWEVSTPPTALNPLGNSAHGASTPTTQAGREEVYQISINWFFYALTH